ncbi:4-amino-4-deoxychorismate lyase [Salinihabitans flavidus]|uniref:Probable branched-chain-amino-acid aminotransferase n=1 Tax=Salinihabitans flavidus TaxID=569882 RepID=A0A1H8QSH3_9RHOB|nr:aminotransferase class IV family protein [Salinihabitans flavidus]SEO56918.1 4-amino-4-deoxychorismate lyase [Salinihabitans flavidus]
MESAICGGVSDGTRLIETFGWHPGEGFRHLNRHLDRMGRSAKVLGFCFDEAEARAVMRADGSLPLRCRLTLGVEGFAFTSAPLGAPVPFWRIGMALARLSSDDPWLRHKTTRRAVYDAARAAMPDGVDEMLFLNERGELCEGTISTLFVTTRAGDVLTPPVTSGCLPGILREILLQQSEVREAVLVPEDLRRAVRIEVGNSLRGRIAARLLV